MGYKKPQYVGPGDIYCLRDGKFGQLPTIQNKFGLDAVSNGPEAMKFGPRAMFGPDARNIGHVAVFYLHGIMAIL